MSVHKPNDTGEVNRLAVRWLIHMKKIRKSCTSEIGGEGHGIRNIG
jgi:hypothetical protein